MSCNLQFTGVDCTALSAAAQAFIKAIKDGILAAMDDDRLTLSDLATEWSCGDFSGRRLRRLAAGETANAKTIVQSAAVPVPTIQLALQGAADMGTLWTSVEEVVRRDGIGQMIAAEGAVVSVVEAVAVEPAFTSAPAGPTEKPCDAEICIELAPSKATFHTPWAISVVALAALIH